MGTQDGRSLLPAGWETVRPGLVELVDPAGSALAWISLVHGANCIGYVVRQGDNWQPVLHSAAPESLASLPSRFGCPVLVPFPGHMVGSHYRWRGQVYQLPSNSPSGDRFMHGLAHTRPWRAVAIEPTRLVAELVTPDDLSPAERAGYPFRIRLRQTISLADGALTIELVATNEGRHEAPVGLGLHPYIDPTLLGGVRERALIELPGRLTRLGRPVPTGETAAVSPEPVSVPPIGETALISRTELGPDAVVTLRGPGQATRVTIRLLAGVNDIMVFAPVEHPSISIEPLSQPLSAASLPEGDPAGLVGLVPHQSRRLAVRFEVTSSPA